MCCRAFQRAQSSSNDSLRTQPLQIRIEMHAGSPIRYALALLQPPQVFVSLRRRTAKERVLIEMHTTIDVDRLTCGICSSNTSVIRWSKRTRSPVTKPAPSDVNQDTQSAISSGIPTRPAGVTATICASASGLRPKASRTERAKNFSPTIVKTFKTGETYAYQCLLRLERTR